ncbi:unnamed protein product [Mytilus coruscus]|uniref:DZIP3-like HEPN domain-containing protein n=1 Tax=Mytilus coruscus TaxID=42192 RepID=A0A6J8A5Y5_MYTCO|nr:unnamed protein product [Mytilus coruscus]
MNFDSHYHSVFKVKEKGKMDKEDKTRYFVVGSVYLEVVTPLFQQKLEGNYKSLNLGCLKDFLDSKPVIHILFHLRHRNPRCCTDQANCISNGPLPINCHQWKQLYAANHGPCLHNCFCKYDARSIKPDDLDVSLCGLLLLNCCNLEQHDKQAVQILRQYKNDYLSHNTTCGITQNKYDLLMNELKTNILQLDQTKEDELIRILNRPLDDALCNKYVTILLDIREIFEKEVLQNSICHSCQEKLKKQGTKEQQVKPYKLGQSIFNLYHKTDLASVVGGDSREVTAIVMMDDGRLVMCLPNQKSLVVCNTDGSHVESIPVQGRPWCVTAINTSTVAVTLVNSKCIEINDINNKLKLKSIPVPGMWGGNITIINNNLVVDGDYSLLCIDHQTGEVIQIIKTECTPYRLHGSGDRIFYWVDYLYNYKNNLCWYSYSDDKHHTLTLPSQPMRTTTLQDGSLYVRCLDGSVQHVSSDGKHYKTVTTKGLKKPKFLLTYNSNQRKLVTRDDQRLIFIFYEK